MGCDIHMSYQRVSKAQKREEKISTILETTTVYLDEWEYINDGPVVDTDYQFSEEWRNYHWFGRMSEVRGEGPRISIEGFPEGVDEADSTYEHSYSYVYLNTLLEEEWTDEDKKRMNLFIYVDIPRMVKYCEENNLSPNEFRILMSYDS